MKRIDIRYGGHSFSVGGRELADLQKEIETGLHTGGSVWLRVNEGEGIRRDAYLLITPGTSISLIPLEGEQ
ncbi:MULTISPECIES: hypothetical protein [unclassified Microbacterium]|uniref:hypothetical protein n=1 Tax=unclassified Microbacterium TaxID=2609290 RepID=UPI00214C13E4|nr:MULTISPECIES: hypothetical protein [unclassified Microbacterium]MCR2799890.1 hypothetical protein [Microbacterium sp. zg.Y818]MCR2825607.1 hypothetical protein [Microbacterium sp. zg.Y909]WIM21872.1 hypothetical protein QNO21_12230 [Microbacterium sp. zg-Y818]